MVDSLTYDDNPPWPTEPDGNGPTLALKKADMVNALPESWAASTDHGTPGTLNDVAAAICDANQASIPTELALNQSVPNPFNPHTTIRYALPEAGVVRLSVYNMVGQSIRTLVDGHRSAGTYAAVWDG